jgi:hypothetical protein
LLTLLFATIAAAITPTPTQTPISIDGVFSESSWDSAQVIDTMYGYAPTSGDEHQDISARFLIDENALYVAIAVTDLDPTSLNAPLVRRDTTNDNDWVGLLLDPYNNGVSAFAFRVNPRGVQADGIFIEGKSHPVMMSLSWDAVFQSAGVITEDGYRVEMAIPFRSLRYPAIEKQTWGVAVLRKQPMPWTVRTWPFISTEKSGFLTQMGTLGPFSTPKQKMKIEILPTTTAIANDLSTDNPNTNLDAGVGLKLGITSGLTLDATINPDFSQIEADEIEVTTNTKVPLYLKEKRPFFLEGLDIFNTPLEVFYSRAVVDPLAGTKLTGRAGKWQIGVLSALDQAPAASTIQSDYFSGDSRNSWDSDDTDDAMSLTDIVRGRRTIGEGENYGFIVADKQLFKGDTRLYNRVIGLDVDTRIGERYTLVTQLLGSETTQSDGDILRDAAWSVALERESTALSVELEHTYFGEDFRAESGYLASVGEAVTSAEVGKQFLDLFFTRRTTPYAIAEVVTTADGEIVGGRMATKVISVIGDRMFTRQNAEARRERFLGKDFDLWTVDGFFDYSFNPRTSVSMQWDIGTQPHYYAETLDDLYRGEAITGQIEFYGSIGIRTKYAVSFTSSRFYKDLDAAPIYDTRIARADIGYSLTDKLSARLVEEADSQTDTLASSALLSAQANYGTAAYLGYTETRALAGLATTDRTVFFKIGYLWRP